MTYKRVSPRDMFNEAKLLKCLGRLYLLYHEEMFYKEVTLTHNTEESERFLIELDENNNSLYCSNLYMRIDNKLCELSTAYNSRLHYPLEMKTPEGEYIYVFDEEGELTEKAALLLRKARPIDMKLKMGKTKFDSQLLQHQGWASKGGI